jgi:hypothetical protein
VCDGCRLAPRPRSAPEPCHVIRGSGPVRASGASRPARGVFGPVESVDLGRILAVLDCAAADLRATDWGVVLDVDEPLPVTG